MDSIIGWFKSLFSWTGFFQKNANIVFLGLDNAGKSTLLYMLQHDRVTVTDSTQYPHSAEVTIGNIKFNSFDLGGHVAARKTWRNYTASIDGVIYIVDAADLKRIQESKAELDQLLAQEELQNVPIVVFGNKVDKPDALSENDLREQMGLHTHSTFGRDHKNANPGARPVEVFMCSVIKRVGYVDGFSWLSEFINK